MKKKPTVVDLPAPRRSSSITDVLESMLSNEATRRLLADPRVKVIHSVDPETGRAKFSFRIADDDESLSDDSGGAS